MGRFVLQINIHTLRIADVDTGSAVAIGNNYFYDWHTCSKTNNGFGRLSGDYNSMVDPAFQIDDPDWQDMLCNEWLAEPYLHKLLE
ncbi:hypothetical protein [Neomoorella thermoacetica]|uniref:Uncharacterized protein n=3 Tax=Neomoorella thermoacetica TaxID=1525 RepID=A0A1D7X7J7_NEOTH|nr:hypothetical protein [Moorella thermoacetica]AKX93219.1 hypothetical protein MOTHE_c04060 [Moorella thermoacetica]AKX95861.1 hypothetical protein MOTHA_c04950 [Moorella thermoacetica]AOQ22883.1 hypothetical protein Maut_00408 [Moorella thermoacetica]APC07551.1 hypothetical protein MTJW_03710 [Moorella thermoacetica]OIQ08277.1 hypothetical protein MOOR_21310 [Moorella thermoacetica]